MIGPFGWTLEDDPDHRPRASSYVSRKDIKWIVLILGVLTVILAPLYMDYRLQGEKAFCTQNMRAIGNAMTQYSIVNNDRFPPAYNRTAARTPALVSGLPVTWSTQIEPYMTARQNFVCPTCKPEAKSRAVSITPGKGQHDCTYGMYRALSSAARNLIANPSQIVIVAETSNLGAEGVFNPLPFSNDPKADPYDGFLIGWDDSNDEFSTATRSVTRLAFAHTENGDFSSDRVRPRHDDIIHAVTAEGSLRSLRPSDALVKHLQPRLDGLWWADRALLD
ncbi:MAG: hypothetical protein KF884_01970 [Fimbriimonadaceae bacterium]|nr:hypothetical protein [Fimbriimonadaceae bacterium]QYK58861.1 MAG: hypothetical protein KF884_01970 [Fimbriimonadaceae bacterium]